MIEPMTASSKAQLAYDWTRARILDGRFSPGYRLVLGQLASELDVSAVPVREAVRRLEAEGLVTFETNVGARVAAVDEREYADVMEALSVVEGAATALSAPALTAADLSRARALNDELRACLESFDPVRFTRLNRELHAVLFGACPNPRLLRAVHVEWDRLDMLRRSTFSFVPERAPASVSEHDALIALIERTAAAPEIEAAVRRHRTATLDGFLAHRADLGVAVQRS
jgi:DNA-binding GntR family transcriptional regulator